MGKTLILGKQKEKRREGKRRREQQRMSALDRIIDSMDMNLSKLQEIVKNRGSWRAAVHVITKSRTHLVTEQQL